jgi:hypothetical protein
MENSSATADCDLFGTQTIYDQQLCDILLHFNYRFTDRKMLQPGMRLLVLYSDMRDW